MSSHRTSTRILIGPRRLDDRICRLVYRRETDEAWAEVWEDRGWQRFPVLVREVLGAPAASRALLRRRGVATEVGEWDREARRA
jgi:hypothetical protein